MEGEHIIDVETTQQLFSACTFLWLAFLVYLKHGANHSQ